MRTKVVINYFIDDYFGRNRKYKSYHIKRSGRKDKKMRVELIGHNDQVIKTVHFGQKGTRTNDTELRFYDYTKRAAFINNGKGVSDVESPNFWAIRFLWDAKKWLRSDRFIETKSGKKVYLIVTR